MNIFSDYLLKQAGVCDEFMSSLQDTPFIRDEAVGTLMANGLEKAAAEREVEKELPAQIIKNAVEVIMHLKEVLEQVASELETTTNVEPKKDQAVETLSKQAGLANEEADFLRSLPSNVLEKMAGSSEPWNLGEASEGTFTQSDPLANFLSSL